MLQGPAHRFRLIAVEAGKTGPEQLSVAFGHHRFGERIGLGEQAVGLTARRVDALQRFTFAFQRADLNDPSGVDGERLVGGVLLGGLRLRQLRARGWIGIGQRLRGGRGGYARCRKHAKHAVSGAVVCRLGGMPGTSSLLVSTLLISALATSALEVSGISGRAGGSRWCSGTQAATVRRKLV